MIKKEQLMYLEEYVIDQRRYFHKNPELGFDTEKTHDYIWNQLKSMGIQVIPHVGKNSLIGIIENGEGPTIGLRADIDALPMQEQNSSLPYRSTVDGKMHACGHDAHAAMLLGACKYLSSHLDEWKGTVKFIFQEAEEGPSPGGAYGICQSGLVNDCDTFFGFHVSTLLPSGTVGIKKGEAMASADTIKIKLTGKGSHAAYPHLGIDPIMMQAEVILGLQTISSRLKDPIDPIVVTIAKVSAGTTHNIIPDFALLEGTVRTFSNSVRENTKNQIEKVLKSVTEKYGGGYELNYIYGYDALINDPQETDYVASIVRNLFGNDAFEAIERPSMGAEDFSKYINLKKGCMGWLGVSNSQETSYGLHHPYFNLDESQLINGSTIYVNFVREYQKG